MTHSEVSRRFAGAHTHLEQAIEALIALDPVPDYVEPLEAAAALLAGVPCEELTRAERAQFSEQAQLLSRKAAQVETLFHSAGALHFGTLLNNNRASGGYTADGSADSAVNGGFHIDG